MRRNACLLIFALLLFTVTSCVREFDAEEKAKVLKASASDKTMLKFTTSESFANIVEQMKMLDVTDIRQLPRSRTTEVEIDPEAFVSLRQSLIDQGLREFTDEELTEIMLDSLEYEPEDSLIVDPYMMCLLNEDREVQVDNKIYKYINDGVIIYDALTPKKFDVTAVLVDSVKLGMLNQGDSMEITDENGVQAELVAMTYSNESNVPNVEHIYQEGEPDSFDNGGNAGFGDVGSDPYEGIERSATMEDGIMIPQDRVNILVYKNNGSTGSWWNDISTSLFGLNLTISNKFDSSHRMKLRLYSQDYLIYKATGMSVRMQKRVLGIWWRKKAQEFRYGWTAMECKYSFKIPAFRDPTPTPEAYTYGKFPAAMRKNFPFAKKDIVLFHIPVVDYDITTGDLNKVFKKGIKTMNKQIEKWLASESHEKYKEHPWGLYTYKPSSENELIVVYPQGEEVAKGKGREVVNWDAGWFKGTYMLSYTSELSGGGFSFNDFDFDIDSPSKVKTIRGRVHAAVKFRDEWRACVIQTL